VAFTHAAFGRTIRSDFELPLLKSVGESAADEPAARLVLSERAVEPEGEKILGSDDTTMTLFRSGTAVLVVLNGIGWIARVEPDSTTITLHPDARRSDREVADSALASRILGDRVVTSVIPFIPQLWGSIALHGSLLATSFGRVMLLGPSGRGKSTLSQVLQRDFGWRVLDDDTSMLVEGDAQPIKAIPMGAYSRLRQDAAHSLGITVQALPGHGGGKGAVVREGLRPDEAWSDQVVATCFLEPRDAEGDRPDGSREGPPEVTELASLNALNRVFESFFVLQADLPDQTKALFRLAANVSSGLTHLRALYVRRVNTPEEVSGAIAAQLQECLPWSRAV
jgi:hypothetical protein